MINNNISGLGKNINFPGALQEETKKEPPMKEPEDVVSFAREGLEKMESMGLSGESLNVGERYLDAIFRKNKGSASSRLARIALKASCEDDILLTQLNNKEILGQISSIGNANIDTGMISQVIGGGTDIVYKSALETIASGMTGSLCTMAAATGLNAMDRAKKSILPFTPAMVAEPYIMGIAEHSGENASINELTDFLADELSPLMTYPSNGAYRAALESIKSNTVDDKINTLAEMGIATHNEIPENNRLDFYQVIRLFGDEIENSEGPYADIMGIVNEKCSYYYNDNAHNDFDTHEVKTAYHLMMTSLNSIREAKAEAESDGKEEEPVKTFINFSSKLINSLSNNPEKTKVADIVDIGIESIDRLNESEISGIRPITETATSIIRGERSKNELILINSMLDRLYSGDTVVDMTTYLKFGLALMDDLKTKGAEDSFTAKVGKTFYKFLDENVPDSFGIPEQTASLIEEAMECENEDKNAVSKVKTALEKLNECIMSNYGESDISQ